MLTSAHTIRRVAISCAAISTAIAALPQSALAGMVFPDDAGSPVAESIGTQYLIVFVLGLLTLLAVVGGLLVLARGNGGAERSGSSSAKPAIFVSATVAIVLAVVGGTAFAGASGADASAPGTAAKYEPTYVQDPQLKLGNDLKPPKGPSITVEVTGQQYLWRYVYPAAANTYSYHELVIPAGVTVMLDVTSSDVAHSWWVPQLGGSIEALPGYVNRGWIRADEPGTFKGASTTVSGTNYPQMTTTVTALPAAEFDAWLAGKKSEIKAAMDELGAERAASASGRPEADEAGPTE
ncbi:MAG: hypothetical protein WAO61_06400 [Solirubrobacterales bacterium]